MSDAAQGVRKRRRSFLSRHPQIKRIVYSAYGVLFVPLVLVTLPVYMVPRRVVYAVARQVAWWVVAPLVREKIERNLTYAYGERMTARRRRALVLKVSANVVWSAVDCYYMWVWWWRYRLTEIVTGVENADVVYDAVRRGAGQFIVTAHYQCFEVMPAYVVKVMQLQGGVVARKFPSDVLNWLNRRVRELHQVPTYYDQMREVVRTLRQNGVVGFLPDLHARKRLSVPATFYGKPTLTLDMHVRMAGQFGCPIIPAFMMRKKRRPWEYTLLVYDALWVPRKPDAAQVMASVQAVNDAFERHIRRYPSGWIWFHNKWGLW